MFGLAEGGIVSKPKIAKIAEKEPEAVIPLSRFGEIMAPQAASPSVSVSVSNHVTVGGGMDDAQVADLMTKITEATKRGTVQGLNMSKVLSAQAKKLGNEAI
jgi:SLT domain-containing protein